MVFNVAFTITKYLAFLVELLLFGEIPHAIWSNDFAQYHHHDLMTPPPPIAKKRLLVKENNDLGE